ncbi:MAG: DUF445 family protein [Balneolaceae bacterium]|nr:MAG: DUF445 family protein [Balneolaceae bacterium]
MEEQKDIKPGQEEPVRSLGNLLYTHLYLKTEKKETVQHHSVSPNLAKSLPILAFLRPLPWILTGFFLFSFFWDFNGIHWSYFQFNLQFEGLLRILSVSGLIGFLTNWIAITMLFRPLNRRPLLGQGLIPAHKQRIAYRLASAVSDDLINPELIKEKIRESDAISRYRTQTIEHLSKVTSDSEFREDLKRWVHNYLTSLAENPEFRHNLISELLKEIENTLNDHILEKAALKTYFFFKGQTLHQFIDELLGKLPDTTVHQFTWIDTYLDELPDRMNSNGEAIDEIFSLVLHRLVNQLDVRQLVEANLKKFDEKRLENMIRNATNEQLRTIQYLGAILGTIGGFVIWEPLISITFIGSVFIMVWSIDRVVFQNSA